MDGALAALYERRRRPSGRAAAAAAAAAGLGGSAPRVARWLGDIRTYFPSLASCR